MTFRTWQHLAEAHTDVEVERTGPDTLVVKSKDSTLINSLTYKLFRKDSDRLDASTVINKDNLKVVILGDSRNGPAKAAFTIPDLDSSEQVCVLVFNEQKRLQKMELPDIGSKVVIPWHGWQ